MRYRARPVLVEAFKLSSDVEMTAPEWFMKLVNENKARIDRALVDGAVTVYGCTIEKSSGNERAKVGQYIVQDGKNSVRVMEPIDFNQLYEAVRK